MSRTPKSKTQNKLSESTVKRRKLGNKNSSTTSCDGENADEVVAHFGNLPNRKNMFEATTAHSRICADGFLKNLEKNTRLYVPIQEKRRVKIDKDEDYIPAQYVKLETSEYVMCQAPTKANAREVWRLIWQDQVKVMINLCHDEQMGDDEKKCYVYYPAEQGQTKEIELKKGKFVISCKNKEGTSYGATRYEFEMTAVDIEGGSDVPSDDPTSQAGKKVLAITLFHLTGWNGKPDAKDAFEISHNVALFCKEIMKCEMSVLRKSMENFVPPVFIQSFDAIGRAAVVWVGVMLCKDVEKRECFDVPELMKKLIKMRPGCLSSYYHFCMAGAVSLWIGKESGWIPENEVQEKVTALSKGFSERKLNDAGIPI